MQEQGRSLGKAIHDRRTALGLTQEELAERINDGVRQSDVSRLERDRIQLPRPQRLRAIARALEMEPGELLAAAGWDGLLREEMAGPAEEPQPPLPPEPVLEPASTAWQPSPDRSHDRLTRALENSRQIQDRSRQSMRRARETASSWARYYESPRSATDHREPPEPEGE